MPLFVVDKQQYLIKELKIFSSTELKIHARIDNSVHVRVHIDIELLYPYACTCILSMFSKELYLIKLLGGSNSCFHYENVVNCSFSFVKNPFQQYNNNNILISCSESKTRFKCLSLCYSAKRGFKVGCHSLLSWHPFQTESKQFAAI